MLNCRYGEKQRRSDSQEISGIQLLSATAYQLKKPYQQLLIPITVWIGMEQAFIGADFTQVKNFFLFFFFNLTNKRKKSRNCAIFFIRFAENRWLINCLLILFRNYSAIPRRVLRSQWERFYRLVVVSLSLFVVKKSLFFIN